MAANADTHLHVVLAVVEKPLGGLQHRMVRTWTGATYEVSDPGQGRHTRFQNLDMGDIRGFRTWTVATYEVSEPGQGRHTRFQLRSPPPRKNVLVFIFYF